MDFKELMDIDTPIKSMAIAKDDLFALGTLVVNTGDEYTGYPAVSLDTRSLKEGEIFFAVKGGKRDGHIFVKDAAGSAGAIVIERAWWNERGKEELKAVSATVVAVNDTIKALGELARRHRRNFDIPVIAVTGSNGKTTTKDMMAEVLSEKFRTHRTVGNFNNHLGLPVTVCNMQDEHQISVVEMGMNHQGEIKYLCSIADPTHALITNIGKGHIGYFNSLEEIEAEKGEVFNWIEMSEERTAFVNMDDMRVARQAEGLQTVVRYSLKEEGVEFPGRITGVDDMGCYSFEIVDNEYSPQFAIRLQIPGRHQVYNALAAATVGISFYIEPEKVVNSLENFRPPPMRTIVKRLGNILLIDDSYNSNPDSMVTSLETFNAMKVAGKRILVLGGMLELGDRSVDEHRILGRFISDSGYEELYTYGGDSKEIHQTLRNLKSGGHYTDKNKLIGDLIKILEPGDAVLIKGSRGIGMDEVVRMIEEVVAENGDESQ